jgi:mono/diheme cytochrome c family protein
MPTTLRNSLILTALLALPIASVAFATACSTGAASTRTPDYERGRYLVERVGLCADCHTPRNEKGELVLEQWLMGSPLPFAPTVPMPFAPIAKPIAGLPTLDDAQAMTFLTTGVLPGGRMPLPPMPPYRFTPDDARDVLAYLRKPTRPPQDPTIAAAATAGLAGHGHAAAGR